MKLKFIGTGSMGSKNCNTSILVNDNILFDIGNGIVFQLDNFDIDLSSIDYVCITHFHGDHISDITNFLIARKIRGYNNKLTIIGPKGVSDKVKDLMVLLYGDGKKDGLDIEEKYNLKYIELENEDTYMIDDITLKAYKLEHGINKEVIGYTLDNKIAYLTDTTICDNVIKVAKNTNHVLLDVTFEETNNAHLGLDKLVELKNENNKLYAVHRGNYDINNISNAIFPNDGDEIEI